MVLSSTHDGYTRQEERLFVRSFQKVCLYILVQSVSGGRIQLEDVITLEKTTMNALDKYLDPSFYDCKLSGDGISQYYNSESRTKY